MLRDLTIQKLGGLKRQWRVSMQALIIRAAQLQTISKRQQQSMFIQLSKAGYRRREPATLDPPVERPSWMVKLAQRHYTELDYSRNELIDHLSINEEEFEKNYGDVWASLDEILKDF